jgi:hypothetical protein
MIDLALEEVFPLSELTSLLPSFRKIGGLPSKLNLSTIYRWSVDGCRGVRLETVQCGATRCTSLEAYRRFCEKLTADRDGKAAGLRSRAGSRGRKATAEQPDLIGV